mgnify:CR=1 FL=1
MLVAVLAIFSACESDLNGSLEPNNGTDIEGCMDPNAMNYNPEATIDDGSCEYDIDIYGCMDPMAINYNPEATIDDSSCEYEEIYCPLCGEISCPYLTTGVCQFECPLCGDPSCDYVFTGECINNPLCPICGEMDDYYWETGICQYDPGK